MLQKAEWSRQILQVLYDELILFNIILDIVLPLLPQRSKPLHITVAKMASQPQFGISLDAVANFIELGPSPDFFTLETVVAQFSIVEVQRELEDLFLAGVN